MQKMQKNGHYAKICKFVHKVETFSDNDSDDGGHTLNTITSNGSSVHKIKALKIFRPSN